MPDPNLRLLQEAAAKLAPFLPEIVFVGGVTLGLLITDAAAAPVRSTNDVDVIAEILTYGDYIAFAERLRASGFSEDMSEEPLTCRWFLRRTQTGCTPAQQRRLGLHKPLVRERSAPCDAVSVARRPLHQADHSALFPGYQNGSCLSAPAIFSPAARSAPMALSPAA